MAKSLFIVGPWGLGDSIYVRPFIAATAQRRDVYYETPWPELFHDLPLRLVRGQRRLRTQMRNLARTRQEQWFRPPDDARTIRLGYGVLEVANGNVATAMEIKLPPLNKLNPVWDLPELGKCPFDTGGAPLAIIRPVMRRIEWDNEARNPYPQYVDEIAGDLKARGFATVVIADLKHGYEWIEGGRLPPHNVALTNGELSVRQLLAAVRDAAVVVGPVGWIVPAAIALHTRAFIILGGNGGMNAPERSSTRAWTPSASVSQRRKGSAYARTCAIAATSGSQILASSGSPGCEACACRSHALPPARGAATDLAA